MYGQSASLTNSSLSCIDVARGYSLCLLASCAGIVRGIQCVNFFCQNLCAWVGSDRVGTSLTEGSHKVFSS
jgi:hypothetical protein